MQVIRDEDGLSADTLASVTAIGVFDGLHRGHQEVVAQLHDIASAQGGTVSVLTFDPHPASILNPERAPRLLMTLAQRLEGLERLGVSRVRVVTFNEALARESAADFIERVLVGELRVSDVVVGEDFRFGHNRAGDVALLEAEGSRLGFRVHPTAMAGGVERWSSTGVRRALEQGDLLVASEILGRPFTLRAVVERGDARGRDLGYPTANLVTPAQQQLPMMGIYAGAARTSDGVWRPAAVSVGTRPQFYESGALVVEVHLAQFTGDLYDTVLDVAFLSRLRGEATFDSLDDLIVQMARDVTKTLEIFPEFSPDSSPLLG